MKMKDLVSGWMSEHPVTIDKDRPIVEAFALMAEHHFRHLPVVEGDDLVGILSSSDLHRAVPLGAETTDERLRTIELLYTVKVGEICSPDDLYTVDPLCTIAETVGVFLEKKVNALPVVDGSRLVGIITSHDLLRALLDRLPDSGQPD